MASEETLKIRAAKKAAKVARKAAERQADMQHEQGQVAAQFITSLARDIYARNVRAPAIGDLTVEELYKAYEVMAHAAMDAAIAFVRASNSYDDRGRVASNAPPILAPTDANGTPVTE